MGEVYRARDSQLSRDVAIKVLANLTSDPDRLRRFEQEARAAAAINHPNILSVYQLDVYEGDPYLVSELLDGETLREQIKRSRLPLRKAIDYGAQIARGLAAAHEKGIVHRDLKPENLFVTRDDRVKILDFGLAKLTHPPEGSELGATTVTKGTEPGMVLGTVGYMSPEQVRGQKTDHHTDIFAFGTILYEMLTGNRAFKKPTSAETMSAILNEDPPPLSQLAQNVPPALQRVVQRCLEKNPEARFQSAADLAFALEALSDSGVVSSTQTAAVTSSSRSRWIGLGAVVAIAAAVILWLRPDPVPVVEGVKQLTNDGQPKPVSGGIASDGSRLYFKEKLSGITGISQVSITGGETARLSSSLVEPDVFEVSPDLSTLLVTTGTSGATFAATLPLPVGQLRRLFEADAAAYFPDGRRIVFVDGINIGVAQTDGSNVQKIAELHGQLLWPVVSPDGKRIRLSALNDGGLSLWELQSDGKGLHLLLPNWKQPHFEFGGKWTPDGNYFVFQREEAGRWDLWALSEKHSFLSNSAREPERITNGPLSYGAPLLSRDGKQIFAVGSQARGELIRYDSTSKQFVPILGGISATDAVFSPDGQWAVYLSYPDHTLWRSRADGSERIQLTYPPTEVFYPHISPDGKQVVYCSWVPGKAFDVVIVSLAGGGPRPVAHGVPAAWSADGKSLVFGRAIPGKQFGEPGFRDLAILELQSGKISQVPDSLTKEGAFWPTQQMLVAGGEQDNLYAFDFKTQKWSELAEGPVLHWMMSPNSQYLYYLKEAPQDPKAMRVRLSDRKIEVVASLQGIQQISDQTNWGQSWVGVAPDGSVLLTRDMGTQEIYAINVKWP